MKKFIKDPIYGEIEIDSSEFFILELLQTREMKRLQNIYQLGESFNVFFGATHTRYCHSLGVFHNAKRFLSNLNCKISETSRKAILAAALLHDIGHGPRSHCFEAYTGFNHEQMTVKIIQDPTTEVNQVLTKAKIDVNEIVKIIKKDLSIPKFHFQIITSQIDADRLDYLLRDSHFTGANYGSIDAGMIFKWFHVYNNEIVFDIKAIDVIEDILFARWQMFKQIYINKKVKLYETIMVKLFKRFKFLKQTKAPLLNVHNMYHLLDAYVNDQAWDVQDFLALNEITLSMIIQSWVVEKDSELVSLASAYLYHNNYCCEDINFVEKTNKQSMEVLPTEVFCYYNQKEPIMILSYKQTLNNTLELMPKEISEYSNFFKNLKQEPLWEKQFVFYQQKQ